MNTTDNDKAIYDETHDEEVEEMEAEIIEESSSTDELNSELDFVNDEDDYKLKLSDFGIGESQSSGNKQEDINQDEISTEVTDTTATTRKTKRTKTRKSKTEKNKNIYCDKAELLEDIRKYQEEGIVSNSLGEQIIKIGIHMSTMRRFWRYSHYIKEEIVAEAIKQMWLSVPKYKLSNKKKNPFGYLSMICYRDMLHSLRRHFKIDKVRAAISETYIHKISNNSPNDERLVALQQILIRNDEFNKFINKSKDKDGSTAKEIDRYALSRKEQRKLAKKMAKESK